MGVKQNIFIATHPHTFTMFRNWDNRSSWDKTIHLRILQLPFIRLQNSHSFLKFNQRLLETYISGLKFGFKLRNSFFYS